MEDELLGPKERLLSFRFIVFTKIVSVVLISNSTNFFLLTSPEKFRCLIACVRGASCTKTELKDSMCKHAEGFSKVVEPAIVEEGTVCPGAANELICPGGYYCPYPTDKPKICKKNFFCPRGSYEMEPCDAFVTMCREEGMEYPNWRFFNATVIFVIMGNCAILYGVYVSFNTFRERRRKKQENLAKKDDVECDDDYDGFGDDQPRMTLADQKELAGNESSYLDSMEDKGGLRMDIKFTNLGLVLKGTDKKVLNGVTGSILSGRVTAVMGPSGAGKTTFMNVLAGKATYGTMTGQIEINGRLDSVFNYSSLCGFVPQEDTMLRDLTIKENLLFYARIRLPASFTDQQCQSVVNETMSTLGLSHIQNSQIGDETKRGISGGQRKRVNVAMEMVSSPSMLFLDEPTSGLDSTTSFELIEALKALASKGTNILVVLHQPSYQLFQLFDDVLLLGKGGSTVFLGESSKCLEYFRSIGFECGLRVNPGKLNFVLTLNGNIYLH